MQNESIKSFIRPPVGSYTPSRVSLPPGADNESIEQQRYVCAFLYPEFLKLAPDQVLWDDRIDINEYGDEMGTD